jgi:CheY-like chemotaxis protein
VVLRGDPSPEGADLEALRAGLGARYEIVEADSAAAAARLAGEAPGSILLGHAGRLLGAGARFQHAGMVVDAIGEGVGLVDSSAEILWMNRSLGALDPETLRRYADACAEAITAFNEPSAAGPVSRRSQFRSGGIWYELVVSPAGSLTAGPERENAAAGRAGGADAGTLPSRAGVESAVGVLWDVTRLRRLQDRIEAVESAGEDLLRLDPQTVSGMDLAQRLKALERSVTHAVQSVLGFEAFEVRLLDRRSGQIDLVISVGIRPLGIGLTLFATPTDNGISGRVAASGRSYVCPDVRCDPLYREGLDDARSSLTVPLLLRDRVIGVLNSESVEPGRFGEEDRLLAEIFGRYLAQALNIFELLVAERTAVREQFSRLLGQEIRQPLDEVAASAASLRERIGRDMDARGKLEQVMEGVATAKARLEACLQGPRAVLGMGSAFTDGGVDPLLQGRRVLVADDEPNIRQTILALLTRAGAEVTVCRDGGAAIERLRGAAGSGRPFDLVISDVRMPDRNGYEVFRAAKDVNAATPVILMTGFGYDPHHSIVRSSQEGLHCFLFKPFEASALISEVRKALGAR